MTPLELETGAVAASAVGVLEEGRNDGPEPRRWLAHVHQPPGKPYCAAFVCCTVYDAGMRVPVLPQLKRTASALRLLGLNPDLIIDRATAVGLMREGRPVVFVINHGGGLGHAGFGVGLVDDECFESIEANTGPGPAVPAKDRDGQGCYRRTDRRMDDVAGWLRVA